MPTLGVCLLEEASQLYLSSLCAGGRVFYGVVNSLCFTKLEALNCELQRASVEIDGLDLRWIFAIHI